MLLLLFINVEQLLTLSFFFFHPSVSLPLSISPLPSSPEDIASFSSTYIVASSSIDDTKTTLSSLITSKTSGTGVSYDVSTSFISLFPSISSPIVPSTTTLANGEPSLSLIITQ